MSCSPSCSKSRGMRTHVPNCQIPSTPVSLNGFFNDPRGWSTLSQVDCLSPRQVADRSTRRNRAETRRYRRRCSIAHTHTHTHGDHIGNVGLFTNATIVMQRAEYRWIHSPNGPNDNRQPRGSQSTPMPLPSTESPTGMLVLPERGEMRAIWSSFA